MVTHVSERWGENLVYTCSTLIYTHIIFLFIFYMS